MTEEQLQRAAEIHRQISEIKACLKACEVLPELHVHFQRHAVYGPLDNPLTTTKHAHSFYPGETIGAAFKKVLESELARLKEEAEKL